MHCLDITNTFTPSSSNTLVKKSFFGQHAATFSGGNFKPLSTRKELIESVKNMDALMDDSVRHYATAVAMKDLASSFEIAIRSLCLNFLFTFFTIILFLFKWYNFVLLIVFCKFR